MAKIGTCTAHGGWRSMKAACPVCEAPSTTMLMEDDLLPDWPRIGFMPGSTILTRAEEYAVRASTLAMDRGKELFEANRQIEELEQRIAALEAEIRELKAVAGPPEHPLHRAIRQGSR